MAAAAPVFETPRVGATTARLRLVLSTIGKFHSFDLARQMHRHGSLRAIFTGYPHFKLTNEGLPPETVHSFPWLHAPYMRLPGAATALRRIWEKYDRLTLDRYVAARLPECDVFCGLSGSALFTGRKAKSRGARYVCDRGSSHIRFQDNILREEFDRHSIAYNAIDPWIVQREEAEYEAADAITVPSQFAAGSFLAMGVPASKIQLVPYGVDLSRFRKTTNPPEGEFRVIFVGNLSLRKGLPYLIEAFDALDHPRKHLSLIGTVSPEMNPLINQLRTRSEVSIPGPLPQEQLKNHLSASHALVLPSIEEGLALVQAQAMACGCPVVASTHTGAADLFTDGVEGFITPIRDSHAIAQRLSQLAADPALRARCSEAALRRVSSVSGWNGYGDRMHSLFASLLQ